MASARVQSVWNLKSRRGRQKLPQDIRPERGSTQLKIALPVIVVDTREENPFDFSGFQGWLSGTDGWKRTDLALL